MRPLGTLLSRAVPSGLKFRLHRVLLTPRVRSALALAVVAGAGSWIAIDDLPRLDGTVDFAVGWVKAQPSIAVKDVTVLSASPVVESAIAKAVDIKFPASPLDIDVVALKETVEKIDAVGTATVKISADGVLEIAVAERRPAILWRNKRGIALLDEEGNFVRNANSRLDYPELNLIVGQGAERAVPEALQIFASANPLRDYVRGLLRIGGRRWDLILDQDRKILLPETFPAEAVRAVAILDHSQSLLSRNLSMVDLRIKGKTIVRLKEQAVMGPELLQASVVGQSL